MRVLFHLGHPAHFHLFKNTIQALKARDHKVDVLIKKKDILEDLLKKSGIEYQNILPKGRKDSKVGLALGVLESDYKILKYAIKYKPNLLIGTSYAISHVGKVLGIPSVNVNEDDAAVVPLYSKLSYPWASIILSPTSCLNGKWENKSIKYSGYHELAYLHPTLFTPSSEVVNKYIPLNSPYFLIRFAKLNAHHDEGIQGISDELALKVIDLLSPYGNVYITSERSLPAEFEKYRLKVNPLDIHHLMAFAAIYIGDSQTMAAEAGVLGTPFIRYNDFVGRIGYLNELENKYKLGFGIKSGNPEILLNTIITLLQLDDRKEVYAERRAVMLRDKINLASFMSWFIENYPNSISEFRNNSDLQYKFK